MSNPVYGKKAVGSSRGEKFSVTIGLLVVGLIMFLVWAPFQAGLFNGLVMSFENPIYWAVIIGSVLLLVWVAAFFKQIKLNDQRDWTALVVLLLPLTYIIALISAASHYFAANMVLVQCLYAFMYVMGLYLLQNKKIHAIIETAIIAVAYAVVLFGLFQWLGQGRTVSAMVGWFTETVYKGQYNQAIWVDANGPRLASVFQYPNTYAAFLMAFLFVAVFGITRSKSWIGQAVHGFMLVPIVLSILLTLSRGGLVFLPIVFIVLLLFLKPAKQILWIVYCLIAGVGTLLIAKPVTELGQQFHLGQIGDPAKGWLYILAASLIISALSWSIQRFVAPGLIQGTQKWAGRKLASLWLPILSVVAVVVLVALLLGTNLKHILPGNIGDRLENINMQQHSVLERFTFYKDAVKVIKDYPVIGAGGGAWASIFEQYQNNPYESRQAHSFAMQYLVEVGMLGFIVFLAFIVFIFYQYIRGYIRSEEHDRESYFVYFIVVFSILIHSMMDFNMSFVFIGMLVFLGLGGMAAVMDNRPVTKLSLKPSTIRTLYSGIVGLGSIILIFVSTQYIQANDAVIKGRKLMETSTDFQEIQAPLERALDKRSGHPDGVLNMNVLLQAAYGQTQEEAFYNQDLDLLTSTLEKEPYNKNLYSQLINLYQLKGDRASSYNVLKDNAYRYVWDMTWYEKLIVQSFELGYEALGNQDAVNKELYFKEGLSAYEHVVDGVEHLKTLPEGQLQGREFMVTPQMSLHAGKIQFLMNHSADAVATLKQGIQGDLNNTAQREAARWYLAALQKTGASDQPLYDQLIQLDPSEKEAIDQLAQLKL